MKGSRTPHKAPAREKNECCADPACTSGLKNNYFEGKRLTLDSFQVEQRYLVGRRHLLNRAIHGWGVVYGYPVGMSAGLSVGPGLALDSCGRELLQTGKTCLSLETVIWLDEHGDPIPRPRPPASGAELGTHHLHDEPDPERVRKCWLLSVHYAEQDLGPLKVKDPCTCDRTEWEHLCETVRYSLTEIPCDRCCVKPPCELECCCDGRHRHGGHEHGEGEDRAPEDRREEAEERPRDEECGPDPDREAPPDECEHHDDECCEAPARGGCRCLCEHLTALDPGGDCCRLREIKGACGRVRVDMDHGVPLACIELATDDCGHWVFHRIVDPCGPRRLVKRNDLLFDLVRGCDLTRICDVGWKDWHRLESLVPWQAFEESFGTRDRESSYWVEFSCAVLARSLTPDCFTMTILLSEDEGGWWEVLRVPVTRVETSGGDGTFVTRAAFFVDPGWCDDAVTCWKTKFDQKQAFVEIEVFGDFIVDRNGQTVDAEVRGLSAVPSGNGTPGGTLRSTFRVEPRGPRQRPSSHEPSHGRKGAYS